MKIYKYENKIENVSSALTFISDTLKEFRLHKKSLDDDLSRISELLHYIASDNEGTDYVSIQLTNKLGDVTLQIFFDGPDLNLDKFIEASIRGNTYSGSDEIEIARIRDHLKNYYHPQTFNHKYTDNLNTLTLYVFKSQYRPLMILLSALFLGVLCGLSLYQTDAENISYMISDDILHPLSTIFMNCIKMLSGPMIFFTVASSIASYSDLNMLGRMGRRLSVTYICNAVIALLISVLLIMGMKPGLSDSVGVLDNWILTNPGVAETASTADISIKDTLINIFPSNIFQAFVNASIMEIIFIALLLGLATAMLPTELRDKICSFLNVGSKLFSKMASLVMIFLPIFVFSSMANAIFDLGAGSLMLILHWLLTLLLTFGILILIYLLLLGIRTGIHPVVYLRKYGDAIWKTFSGGSSGSGLQTCIAASESNLGVSKMVASFSLPIGSTLHSASNIVFYTISLFFLANLYCTTPVDPLQTPALLLEIFILAIGAPTSPGSGPICVAVLLHQIGIPMGLITLIFALDPFINMIKAGCNCIEDSYTMLVLAKSVNMIDQTVLNRTTD